MPRQMARMGRPPIVIGLGADGVATGATSDTVDAGFTEAAGSMSPPLRRRPSTRVMRMARTSGELGGGIARLRLPAAPAKVELTNARSGEAPTVMDVVTPMRGNRVMASMVPYAA
jgi:hypothetical protein